jgi:hypothetical protein
MGWFLQYWALLTHQDFRLGDHDVACLRSSKTGHHRAVKTQAKTLLLVDRCSGRHEIEWRFARRTSTGRADQKVSCCTNL